MLKEKLLNSFFKVKNIHFHVRKWQPRNCACGYRVTVDIIINDNFVHKIDFSRFIRFDFNDWINDAIYWLNVNGFHNISDVKDIESFWMGDLSGGSPFFKIINSINVPVVPIANGIEYSFVVEEVKNKKELFSV
jgi:hypothetical protein